MHSKIKPLKSSLEGLFGYKKTMRWSRDSIEVLEMYSDINY